MNKSLNLNSFYERKSTKVKLLTIIKVFILLINLGFGSVYANSSYSLTNLETNQGIEISGSILDSNGQPLPGANILEKGTTNGTQSDFNGNFSLTVTNQNAVLVVSYIGFITKEIEVNSQTNITVTLQEDTNSLDEVVVTGYTSQLRGELTGAVSSVDMDEALKAPMSNAAEALEGRVTGVSVINNGTPGSAPKINIRGFGTSNSTNPLFIIDGVQTEDANVLNQISPSDIDQMNVLKDAAAAIYGARASNGVVIITTKSGGYNMDEAKVSVDFYSGISRFANKIDLLNVQQHADMIWEGLSNDGATLTHGQYGTGSSPVIPTELQGYSRLVSFNPNVAGPRGASVTPGGTDWIDEISENAPTYNATISVQNGTDTGKYYMSANYLKQDGAMIHTGFERGSAKLNSEFKALDKILTIGQNMNVSYSNTRNGVESAMESAIRMSPLVPTYDDEGDFAGTQGSDLADTNSPLAQLYRAKDDYDTNFAFLGNIYANAKINDQFSVKTQLSGALNSRDVRSFVALNPEHSEPSSVNSLTIEDHTGYNWTWTNTISYNNTFGDHKLNVLLGVEAVENGSKGKSIMNTDYLFETPDYYLLSNGAGVPVVNSQYERKNSLFSVFGTANYSYAGKYFATVTLRNDKSSRFLGDNKSQTFPSISGGWLISKEDFFNSDSFINRLNLRASWGQLGNQSLPGDNPTTNISILDSRSGYYPFNGSNATTGAILKQVGNPDLKWETSETINIGIDLEFLDSRLNTTLELYRTETKDLITPDNSLISTTAIDAVAPLVNRGNVLNTGFDLNIGWNDITESGFSYGANLNLSHYKNEVTELISNFITGYTEFRGGAITRSAVGHPISSFYGRVVEGLDDSGRMIYKDVVPDGVINDEDRTFIGSPHPDYTFGLNLSAAFKGFDLSALISGSQGNEIYNYTKIYTDFPTFGNGNRSVAVLNAWSPSNPNGTVPALSNSIQNSETQPNSYFVEDGSYTRLKNLQVGYTFPTNVSDKMKMDVFRIFLQGTNLLTSTSYSGFDPELIPQDNLTMGVDWQIYPLSQILTIGLNVKF